MTNKFQITNFQTFSALWLFWFLSIVIYLSLFTPTAGGCFIGIWSDLSVTGFGRGCTSSILFLQAVPVFHSAMVFIQQYLQKRQAQPAIIETT